MGDERMKHIFIKGNVFNQIQNLAGILFCFVLFGGMSEGEDMRHIETLSEGFKWWLQIQDSNSISLFFPSFGLVWLISSVCISSY